MIITFVHHSCFVVEMDETVLVFDYFRNENVKDREFTGVLPKLDANKQIYVFASHFHKDHFDLEVLRWAENYPHIHYILSKDIRLGKNYLERNAIPENIKEKITFVRPRAKYNIGDMEVSTLRSTDCGVAYLVKVEGKCIYHAGDLNAWIWDGIGELINGKEAKAYKNQINKLANEEIDVAFVVVDSRQKQYATEGLDYFMKYIDARVVFPMHMWQDYSVVERYKSKATNAAFVNRLVSITGENEAYEL